MSPGDEGAAVQEEGQVRADHHHEALSEVPVPGVCTVKLSHVVQHVKLQEVPLDKSPLNRTEGFYGKVCPRPAYFHEREAVLLT